MPKEGQYIITYGGWYQRTTLHLSEIYSLFILGHSYLPLSKEKLKKLQKLLDLKTVTREAKHLEFIEARTHKEVDIRYFEDGLYVLETTTDDIAHGQQLLKGYFDNRLNPAISYIFSLGAPTPKVLANIKAVHPTVVGVIFSKPEKYDIDTKKYGEVYSKITSKNITVYKTPKYIFVVSSSNKNKQIRRLIEMQIFFREFKDQLEKYLNIHRHIWEEIESIKNKKFIKGKEIGEIREKLESYRKTIDLINSRINQMGSYVGTRQSISKDLEIEEQLNNLFQYKFEILSATHSYIKEIWNMTKDHVASAIQVIVEIENKTTTASIKTLQVITSIGVVSGILGYLARNELPKITNTGLIFFLALIFVTWLINLIVAKIYKNLKYKLKFTKRASKI